MQRGVLLTLTLATCLISLPVTLGAQAQETVVLKGTFSSNQENPPLPGFSGFGTVTATVNRTAGTITCTGAVYNLGSALTAAHIHSGGFGANGPVVLNLGPPAGPLPAGVSNDFGFTFTANLSEITLRPEQGIRSVDDFIQALVSGMTYFNIHTAFHGGGEVRAQLLPPSCFGGGPPNSVTGVDVCGPTR